MKIDRHNYEEFFLLYVDNELSAEEKKAVENFVAINTDLKQELRLLHETVLHPEPQVTFDLKSSLLKKNDSLVHEFNYQEYFLLYADNELDAAIRKQVEEFAATHPNYESEFAVIQQARFQPDTTIVFGDKSELYRKEKDDKVVPFTWWKLMAAAVILLAVGITSWFLMTSSDSKPSKQIVTTTPATTPALLETNKSDAVAKRSSQTVAPSSETENPAAKIDVASRSNPLLATSKKIDLPEYKKSKEASNISHTPDVSPVDVIAKVEQPVPVQTEKADPVITVTPPVQTVASLVNNVTAESAVYTESEQDNDIVYVANTSVSKKNKLRGIFRKASRFIEKATHLDATNRGIRVANIEVGLK
ncbi:MAG TPA: hypothetical protein VM012_11605 [Flavitalea sp.]|nr:hypothetical protein [Flavitalea sp.]